MSTQALTFNLIGGFYLLAGFNAEIRAGLPTKEAKLITLALIKAEAIQIELSLVKKKKKSTIGTNGNNGNGSKPVLINQIWDENPDHIEVIKENEYRPKNNGQSQPRQQHQSHRKNGLLKCTHCKKNLVTQSKNAL